MNLPILKNQAYEKIGRDGNYNNVCRIMNAGYEFKCLFFIPASEINRY
jgi:hypothetical protein